MHSKALYHIWDMDLTLEETHDLTHCCLMRVKCIISSRCFASSVLQLTTWFDELKVELSSSEIADCVETGEQLIGQFEQQKEATTDACVNTITEGENILDQIRLVRFQV